ncbi:MAG: S8 family serine peptidase [Alphaproteobacteria bacterium]|nr:S8 family serine peptidase [Alphaproteobacteria bacterium]
MMWLLLVLHAHAGLGPDGQPLAGDPPELVRVDDPNHPGALVRTGEAALLAAPPTDGTPWSYETLAVPDGWTDELGSAALNADLWHARGWRGQGVRVAVFDIQWEQATLDPLMLGEVQTADCVAHRSCALPLDSVAPTFGYEVGAHGVACADTVHDLAPEAELFAVRVNGVTTFASAAEWAIREGIDVISMSMSFFNDSFYDGTGPFTAVLQRLEAHDVLVVTSAGNYARAHWDGAWRDVDGDGRLDFDGSNGLELGVQPNGGRPLFVTWNEFNACGLSDLDAYVYAPDGLLVGRSERRQDDGERGCDPVERVAIQSRGPGVYRLEVVGHRVQAAHLQVDVLGTGGVVVVDPVVERSLADPAAHPLAFVVGAVRAEGYLGNDIEGFSSRGPSRAGVPKPDLAGPDGLSTSVFGARGFFGTSAATPAVAAAVALVMSRDPSLTPRQAAQRLQAWAWSEEDPLQVEDPRWGPGKARLPLPEALDAGGGGCGRPEGTPAWLLLLLLSPRRRGAARRASCRSTGGPARRGSGPA